MPTANDFLTAPPRYIVVLCGPYGSGKSDAMMTFPAVYPATFDPAGLEFLKNRLYVRGQELAKNLAAHPAEFSGTTNLATLFSEKTDQEGSIRKWIADCKALAKEGTVKTIGLDGITYLGDMLRAWQESRSENYTATGELNTIRLWQAISLWWSRFMLSELMPLCSRYSLNIVITCHVQRLSELTVEGGTFIGQKVKGKVQKDSDLAPMLEGRFKDTLGGIPGAMIYLDHVVGQVKERDASGAPVLRDGKPVTVAGVQRIAYCDKVAGMDTVIQAKNRYNLPAKLSITDRSLYHLLLKYSGWSGGNSNQLTESTESTEPNSIQDKEKEQTA